MTAFEARTFELIHDWLNGRETFQINTSGSTGQPKPIAIHRDQMIMSSKLSGEALGLRPGFDSLICIDTRFIGGTMMIIRSLVLNLYIQAVEPNALPLLQVPDGQCVKFAAFVPYQVHAMLELNRPQILNNVETMIIGGAALHPEDRSRLQNHPGKCFAAYGMTETLSHIALQRLNGPSAPDYFQTLPSIEISTDERECLVIKAPYLRGPVITNDCVELINNRQFRWKGRFDNVINTGGIKVSPEQIEASIQKVFSALKIPHRFFVHSVPDRKLGARMVLVLETAGEPSLAVNEAMNTLEDIHGKHQTPRELHLAPSFTETTTGKINRLLSFRSVNRIISVERK